ncbi:MAG: alpha/beta hydrolase [Alphaproteobacteria bacterium]|nr:alpha/beta hydrolase [Alphaproteobacteria bacterium]
MAYLTRDGVRIFYEDEGTGIPIFLSHGFGASTRMWDGQVAEFSDRYRFIRWDMRGHGQSDSPDDPALYSQAHTLGDILGVLDYLEIDKAVIGGHSLGGYMTLAFNARHPDRTKALILQGCGPGYRSDTARATWNIRAENRALSLEEGGLDALGGGAEVNVIEQKSALGLANAARGILSQVDAAAIDSLPGIDVPVLILIGDGDEHYLQGSAYMASRIPGAINVTVPNAGHGVNVDQPNIVNKVFGEFLAGI